MYRLAATIAGATLALLVAAVPASASSIVFVHDHNVWLMNPDGSSQYQVTLDGTAAKTYESPSQADDGTIAAIYGESSSGDQIVRMRQNGQVLSAVTPEVIFDGIDSADISPDGTKVAYMTHFNGNSDCSGRGSSKFCYSLRVADAATGHDLGGTAFDDNPEWISNSRLLVNNDFQRISTYDVGAADESQWFGRDINDDHGNLSNDSLYDPDLGGNHAVAYKQTPFEPELILYRLNGGPPAQPSPICSYKNPSGGNYNDPSWSPDGSGLAWEASDRDPNTPLTGQDGIVVVEGITDTACPNGRLVAPGGEEPDWGPAGVNPGPRGGGGGAGSDTTPPDVAVAIAKVKLVKALKKGLVVKVQTSEAGAAAIEARVSGKAVARGSRALPAAGTYTVKVKFTKKAQKKYATSKKLKLTLRIGVADAAGNTVGGTRKVTLKR